MNIEQYKLIFNKILNNKEFDFYKKLVKKPTVEKTFEIISKDITDGDIKKYEQYTYVKIRDYFSSQFRKQSSVKKKEYKIKYYLNMISFLNAGNSIYELGKRFKLKNPRVSLKRIIKYLNKHSGTIYDYEDFRNEKFIKKEHKMTKIEKIQYQKDYEAGLKAFPLEVVLKNEAKQKRSNDKRKITIAKKAAKESISDYTRVVTENEMLKSEIEQLKAEINRLKQLKDINSDIPTNSDIPVEESEKESIEIEKNIENWSEEKLHAEIINVEKLVANWNNEVKNFIEESDNKNSDIPPAIEDRFQEFINKKYIGPAEATLLYKGLNPYINFNFIPKYKANGYIVSERNITKNSNNNTPQQIIADAVMKQYELSGVNIKDENLKNRFFKLIENLSQVA